MFFSRPFGSELIVEYYYGTIVNLDLKTQKQIRKVYGDGVMSVTMDDFCTWAFKIPERFLNGTIKENSAWIVTARFSCMRFRNGSRYLPEDKFTRI